MQEEIPFEMQRGNDEAPTFTADPSDWRRRGAPRMEAATARELVKRLSIFRSAPAPRAPMVGSGDPTVMESSTKAGDGSSDDDTDRVPPESLSATALFTSSSRQRGSMIFLGDEDDDDDEGGAADLHRNLSSTLPSQPNPNGPGTDEEEAVVERFDNEGIAEYGRAANERAFDEWLDFGEQTTLADRMLQSTDRQETSPRKDEETAEGQFDVGQIYSRTIDRQVVGCGFGEEAIKSIVDGEYDPASILPSLVSGFWNSLDDQTFLDACEIAVDKDEEEEEAVESRYSVVANVGGVRHSFINSHKRDSVSNSAKTPALSHDPEVATTTTPLVPNAMARQLSVSTLSQSQAGDVTRNTASSSAYRVSHHHQLDAHRIVRTRSVVALEEFFRNLLKVDGGGSSTPSINASTIHMDSAAHPTSSSTAALVPPLSPPAPDAANEAWDLSILSRAAQEQPGLMKPLRLLPTSGDGAVRPSIVQYQPEIERTMGAVLITMSAALHPWTFHEFLAACSKALDVLNEGDPYCEVTLFASTTSCVAEQEAVVEGSSTPRGSTPPAPLIGAEAVMQFVKAHMFDKAQEFGSTVYAAEWVYRYTIAFLNARVAVDAADALAREEMVAQCIQQLADIDKFTTTVLCLSSKARHYDEFTQLRQWMEAEANAVLEPIENRFRSILTRCPFPEQRAVLKKHYKRLEALTATAVKFLSAFDGQWSSTIPYHAAWKEDFLNRGYMRLHGNIATAWMTASLGFVDPVLTMIIKVDSMYAKQPHAFRKRISTAARVEQMIVLERATFNQIALTIKGVGSSVVGLQLCMGARYILDETAATNDGKWGFTMCDGMPTFETASAGAPAKQRGPRQEVTTTAAVEPAPPNDDEGGHATSESTPQSPQWHDPPMSSRKASPVSSFAV